MQTNIFAQPPLRLIDLNAQDVFIGMALAFVLSAILSRISTSFNKSGISNPQLPATMVLLSSIVSLIMAVIGNSLARAFGAIGALSLIRFRTAIKDPRDLANLFMSISVGMACGSGYLKIAMGATALYCAFMAILHILPLESNNIKVYLIKLKYEFNEEIHSHIIKLINKYCISYKILSQESSDKNKTTEFIIETILPVSEKLSDLPSELAKISPDIKITIIGS